MDGLTENTEWKGIKEEIKAILAKVELQEQAIASIQTTEQIILKAIQELHTSLKHFPINKYHDDLSKNSENGCSNRTKRKPLRSKRLLPIGYRKTSEEFSSHFKGKKQKVKTDVNATEIVHSRTDEAACEIKSLLLAKAIQEHFVELVSQLPFDESELSDMLIPDCLTEDENQTIRKLPSRKSKLRSLLCLLIGRDYGILEKFLTHAKSFDAALVDTVWKTFDEKLKMGNDCPLTCILCSIKDNVEISFVIDHLYSRDVVSKMFVQKIACCLSGTNNSFWNELYEVCLNQYDKRATFEILAEALEAKGYYKHLSQKLRKSEGIYQLCMCPKIPPTHIESPMVKPSFQDNSDSPYTSLSLHSTSSLGGDTSSDEIIKTSVSTALHEQHHETIISGENCIGIGKSGETQDKTCTTKSYSKHDKMLNRSCDERSNTATEPSHKTLYNIVYGRLHNPQIAPFTENPANGKLLSDIAGQESYNKDTECSRKRRYEISANPRKGTHEKAEIMRLPDCRKLTTNSSRDSKVKECFITGTERALRPEGQRTSSSKSSQLEIDQRLQKSDRTNTRRRVLSESSSILPTFFPSSECSFRDKKPKRVIISNDNSTKHQRCNGQNKTKVIYKRNGLQGSKSAPGSLDNLTKPDTINHNGNA